MTRAYRATTTGLTPCQPSPVPGEATSPRTAPNGHPWPQGHGLQRPASGLCWCGETILTCEAMGEWLTTGTRTIYDDVYDDCLALLAAPGTHEQRTSNVMARLRATLGGTA